VSGRQSIIPHERIERAILLIRDEKVILDTDIAALYGVDTRTLVQAVKRNLGRFPADFMFQLSSVEYKACLTSQSVTSKGRGGRRTRPYAFTEQGVAMLSSILRSDNEKSQPQKRPASLYSGEWNRTTDLGIMKPTL
jgi:hypothetical protein